MTEPRPADPARRRVLRAAGVSLALPWLETFDRVAAAATAAETASPTRLAFIFFPNGALPENWDLDADGPDAALSPTLAPLEPHRGDFTVFSGFAHKNAESMGDGAGGHARNAGTYLTGAHPVKTTGRGIRAGQSIDQFLADRLAPSTLFRSLEIATEPNRMSGRCDSGYGCAYSNSISWRTATRPNPTEHHPRALFERLFGGGDDADRLERIARRRSVLDFVAADAKRLGKSLATADRGRVDEYLTSVRDVERRLDRMSRVEPLDPGLDLDASDYEGAMPTRTERIDALYDLLALAYRTDRTRIASFMLGKAGSQARYPEVGVTQGHHTASHHQGTDEKKDALRKVDRLLVERFARFLDTLRTTPDGEGRSLLDNTLVLYGSGIGDGNRHRHKELPIVLAGGGDRIRHVAHRRVAEETPLCDLFVTIGEAAGAGQIDRFGDSEGPLPMTLA